MNLQPAPIRGLFGLGLVLGRLASLGEPFPGDPDPTFRLDPSLPPASEVLASAPHPDGRLLAVFAFATGPELVALNPDGSLDTGFARRPLPGVSARRLTVLADGRILTAYQPADAPTNTARVIRLSARGEVDPTFSVDVAAPLVGCLAPMADGSLMLGAVIANGTPTQFDDFLHRILPDGRFDPGFAQSGNFTRGGSVSAVLAQGDGYVVLGGGFLYRLDRSGQRDEAFRSPLQTVDAVAMTPEGKLLVSGELTDPTEVGRRWVLRLNADGSQDSGFPVIPISGQVLQLVVQADGSSLLGGDLVWVGGLQRWGVARLLADGRADVNFKPALWSRPVPDEDPIGLTVRQVGELADGRIFATGRLMRAADAGTNLALAVFANVATPDVPSVSGLPSRIQVIEGHTLKLVPRLNAPPETAYEWKRGGTLLSSLPELHLRNVQLRDSGPIRLTVTMPGSSFSQVIEVEVAGGPSHAGSVDVSFASEEELRVLGTVTRPLGLTGGILPTAVAVTDDGAVLLGGAFADGNSPRRPTLVRIRPDGSRDATFQYNPVLGVRATVAQVFGIRVLRDHKILVAAYTTPFVSPSGSMSVDAGAVFRLLPDGRLDTTFGNRGFVTTTFMFTAMDVDAAERIVILDRWRLFKHMPVRFLPNGSRDESFSAPDFSSSDPLPLRHLSVLPDGSMFIGGRFDAVGGQPRNSLVRLRADGSLDGAFVPAESLSGKVGGLLALPDDRLLVSDAPARNGLPPYGLVRLRADGSVDPSFRPTGPATNGVYRIGRDAAGRILAAVINVRDSGDPDPTVVRMLPDGSADPEFRLGLSHAPLHVLTLSFASDPFGQIFMTGDFRQPDGLGRKTVVRLNSNDERRIAPGHTPDGRAQLRINSRPGRTYVVEQSPALNPANWSELTRLTGTGALLEWTAGAADSDGFYRVRLE